MFDSVETSIPEVIIIKPKIFADNRGWFFESYNQEKFAALGIRDCFVQDNHSKSKHGTLRGLHYQLRHQQSKLCRVVRGEVLDVAVDIRRGSPTWGKWVSVVLSEDNKCQVYIPKGFAHGFVVVSDEAEFLYKCTDFYDPASEQGIHWADPQLAIDWRIRDPLVSEKDSRYPRLADVAPDLLPQYETS